MHPEKIADIGLTNAISNELQMIQRAAKLSTEIITEDKEVKLSNEKSIIVFRMIQEMLHNILKHAKAKKIFVKIKGSDAKTIIEIIDDGVGFNLASLKSTDTGIGLKSIQQRCKLINASCDVDSKPGSGTSIQLIIQNL
jgi:signal transduction histidine kinase